MEESSDGERIVRFPRRNRLPRTWQPDLKGWEANPVDWSTEPSPDDSDGVLESASSLALEQATHRLGRRGQQAVSEIESMPRYIATAAALLIAVIALGYVALQFGQSNKPVAETQPAPVAAAPAAPTAASVAAPQARTGQGVVRVTSRVVEPSYSVLPGDTLASIATKFGTSVEALQGINNLADRNVLTIGQKLVIPNQD